MIDAATERPDRLLAPPSILPGPRVVIEAKLRSASLVEQARLEVEKHFVMAWRLTDLSASLELKVLPVSKRLRLEAERAEWPSHIVIRPGCDTLDERRDVDPDHPAET